MTRRLTSKYLQVGMIAGLLLLFNVQAQACTPLDGQSTNKICRVATNTAFSFTPTGLTNTATSTDWIKEVGPDWAKVDAQSGVVSGTSNGTKEAHYIIQKAKDGTQFTTLMIVGDQAIAYMGANETIKTLAELVGIGNGTNMSPVDSGTVIIVRDGEYFGADNELLDSQGRAFFWGRINGTASNYTTLIAENPGKARFEEITMSGAVRYLAVKGIRLQGPFRLQGDNDDGDEDPRFIKVMSSSTSHGAFFANVGASDILFEDVIAYGGGRAQFWAGSQVKNIIFRRCVARQDYVNSSNPSATVLVYGFSGAAENIAFQNCVIVDQSKREENFSTSTLFGAFEFLNPRNISVKGSVVVNHNREFILDNRDSEDVLVENSAFWGTTRYALRVGRNQNISGTENFLWNNLTVGGINFGGQFVGLILSQRRNGSDSATVRMENSIISDATWMPPMPGENEIFEFDFKSTRNNVIHNIQNLVHGNVVEALTEVSTRPIQHIVNSDHMNGGERVGAKIEFRRGVSGSLWGETGYDDLTSDSLWPYPQEDRIRDEMSQLQISAGGIEGYSNIVVNDGTRGFVSHMSSAGVVGSLTAYIWEYLGNPMPAQYAYQNANASGSPPNTGTGTGSDDACIPALNLNTFAFNIPAVMYQGRWYQVEAAIENSNASRVRFRITGASELTSNPCPSGPEIDSAGALNLPMLKDQAGTRYSGLTGSGGFRMNLVVENDVFYLDFGL
ncbi:MAG: hypothetical protein AAF512_12270 [Pseudomonadota bacterium]